MTTWGWSDTCFSIRYRYRVCSIAIRTLSSVIAQGGVQARISKSLRGLTGCPSIEGISQRNSNEKMTRKSWKIVNRSYQFSYWIVRPLCTSWTTWNNRKVVQSRWTYTFSGELMFSLALPSEVLLKKTQYQYISTSPEWTSSFNREQDSIK